MGWAAWLKLRDAVDGLRRDLAIEILVASRALDLRAPSARPPPPEPLGTSSVALSEGPVPTNGYPPRWKPWSGCSKTGRSSMPSSRH